MQASGIESLVRLLLHDAAFARAVQQKDGETAAAAAVGLVKSHFKTFANVLRPPGASAGANQLQHADSGSPTAARRIGAAAAAATEPGRRASDAGGALLTPQKPSDIKVKDRVVINVPHKKYEGEIVGKHGTVLSVTHNGWVKVQVCGEVLDFQMRHVSLLPRTPAGNMVGSSMAGHAAGALRNWGRKPDAAKQLRRELLLMEEEVPWKEVVDRWKTVRQRWSKTLKTAETPQQFAGLMAELHDHLRTDKASGLFASGGPWESQLMSCVRGELGMTHLVALWEDMKAAVQTWLAAGILPGGLDALDRHSYEQALATYAVLQDAASKGLESLEQIPLDQILTTQRDVLALQHVIQRELTATHSKLQAVAGGAMSLAAAAQPPPLLPPDWTPGVLSESLLLQLGKLPRLAARPGDDGTDTDKDAGSDATDVGGLDAMDLS